MLKLILMLLIVLVVLLNIELEIAMIHNLLIGNNSFLTQLNKKLQILLELFCVVNKQMEELIWLREFHLRDVIPIWFDVELF